MDNVEELGASPASPAGDQTTNAFAMPTTSKLPQLDECRELLVPEDLRQGDIIQWIDTPDPRDVWHRFGVIVTADCDLAHKKHGGVVSYCPILKLEDYLRLFWFRLELDRQVDHVGKIVQREIARLQEKYSDVKTPVSPDMVPSWLERRGPDGVAEDIGLPTGQMRQTLQQILELYRQISAARESNDIAEQVRALVQARTGSLRADRQKQRETESQVWERFHGHAQRLPGDWFFLTRLPSTSHRGFLVYLRRIQETPEDHIAVAPDQESSRRARRLGRLNPPFLYRLTQQLAAVFADIGLPSEYEKMCDETVRSFTDILKNDPETQ